MPSPRKRRAAARAPGPQARNAMTPWVATIGADATVREAARIMIARRVSALPVLDASDRLVGIVSEGDLVRRAELGTDAAEGSWWLRSLSEDTARDYLKAHAVSISDVMTRKVVSVRSTTPLREVARLLHKRGIKRVPVMQAGRLVGILSRADLVRRLAAAPAPRVRGRP
jgi:CBS domain-containing protein